MSWKTDCLHSRSDQAQRPRYPISDGRPLEWGPGPANDAPSSAKSSHGEPSPRDCPLACKNSLQAVPGTDGQASDLEVGAQTEAPSWGLSSPAVVEGMPAGCCPTQPCVFQGGVATRWLDCLSSSTHYDLQTAPRVHSQAGAETPGAGGFRKAPVDQSDHEPMLEGIGPARSTTAQRVDDGATQAAVEEYPAVSTVGAIPPDAGAYCQSNSSPREVGIQGRKKASWAVTAPENQLQASPSRVQQARDSSKVGRTHAPESGWPKRLCLETEAT